MQIYKKIIFLLSIFVVVCIGAIYWPTPLIAAKVKIAVTTKVKGKAELRSFDSENFKQINSGTVLFDQDYLRTGSDGFIAIVYLDDKSLLKIRQNTDMVVKGTRSSTGISKKIDLTAGTLRAEVSKKRKGEFIIYTPTSVASVKGTTFYIVSSPLSGDQVYGIEGVVELMNLISGTVVEVLANQTGTSLPDGSIDVSETNPEDLPEEEEEETGVQELRIKLQNSEGEEKDLIIKFQ